MDFTFSAEGGMTDSQRLGNEAGDSIYGGGRVASQITGGMILTGLDAERGPYGLNNGFSSPTASLNIDASMVIEASGTVGANGVLLTTSAAGGGIAGTFTQEAADELLRYDPDLVSGSVIAIASFLKSELTDAAGNFNFDDMVGLAFSESLGTNSYQVRRLTATDPTDSTRICVVANTTTASTTILDVFDLGGNLAGFTHIGAPLADAFDGGSSIGSVIGEATWGLENNTEIPEIDIKVDSVSVTAVTKKLKAKWTPELGQDLNAYHNMDAEVELTSILSEQVALEIDREILEDLVKGATASTYYWSRRPGRFVDRSTGIDIGGGSENEALLGADFTGNVSEWYETLIETINDVSAQIHRKTLHGGANFVVVSPEMANLLEFTAGFRAAVTHDDDRGTIGAVRVGSLSKKFDVYVDPYFLRNVVLVGRKGASFLESGYVYAPYVPLQVTPTIFGVEDFVPRKGVMTRYAKKMVRPDMYGLVIVKDLLG